MPAAHCPPKILYPSSSPFFRQHAASKQGQLHPCLFIFKCMQICKDLLLIRTDSIAAAVLPEDPIQGFRMGTGQRIGIAVNTLILLLQTRKMLIQLPVIVFPVSLPQSQTHAKDKDPPHTCIPAGSQNGTQILRRIIDVGQQWRQPHHCGDPPFPTCMQRRQSGTGGSYTWLQNPAKGIIVGSDGHLYHTFCNMQTVRKLRKSLSKGRECGIIRI